MLAAILFAATMAAAPVQPEKAMKSANQFMQEHRAGVQLQKMPANTSRICSNAQNPAFYIFNTTGKNGYVIV